MTAGEPIGARVAAQAELWIGTPFVWQGRARGRGCDCKGLVAGVARELERPEAESVEALAGDYGVDRRVPVARLRAGLGRLFDRASVPEPGDVLLLALGGKAQHLAIFAPPGPSGALRVIESMNVGPRQVRPFRRRRDEVDSIWRWRPIAGVGAAEDPDHG